MRSVRPYGGPPPSISAGAYPKQPKKKQPITKPTKKFNKSKKKSLVSRNDKKKETNNGTLAPLTKKEIKHIRLTKKKVKELKKMRGEFKRDLPDIYQLLDSGGTARQIQRRFYLGTLAAVVDLIPVLESKTSKSAWDRDVYALNSVIAQGMDILNNLHTLDEAQQQAHDLNSQVIEPQYNTLAAQFVTCLSILRDNVDPYIKPECEMKVRQIFQTSGKEFGAFLDISEATTKDNVIRHIG